VQKITNKQYEEYQKLLDDKRHGRMLTPDGLRLICSACNYDPTEKRSSMTHLCKSQVVMLFFSGRERLNWRMLWQNIITLRYHLRTLKYIVNKVYKAYNK
jgi:REP element-mobilizing transposase RayT